MRKNNTQTKNSSSSVGVFVGMSGDSYGIGLEGSASQGRGKTNQSRELWQNNRWQIGNLNTTSRQGGLTLETTTLNATGWTGELNHLNLISRQDQEDYRSENKQAGVQGSITYGSGGSASANLAYHSAKLSRSQVKEQTQLNVGEGGMNVSVKGHTELTGAIITSQAKPENNRLQTETISEKDIENRSELETKSISVSAGTNGANMLGTALSLLGNKKESDNSLTKSAIGSYIQLITADLNANAINRNTANANEQVKSYDLAKEQENQEIGQLTAELGSKLVGDLSKKMKWEDGSTQKIALHGFIGFLSAKWGGGNALSGALASGGSEYLNTELSNYLRTNTNLTENERNALQQLSAMGIGTIAGVVAKGNGNEVLQSSQIALRSEVFNRQLHPTEQQRINDLANKLAKEKGKDAAYWREKLTLASSAMIDEQADKLVSGGISEISRSPFAERANYSQDLKIAYDIMKKEALKNEALKWRDGKEIELYGEKVKMFQSTERQFKDNKMFGNVNYPSLIQKSNLNNNPLNDIGKLNGLGENVNKYSSELLGIIAEGNKGRQNNYQVLNKDYYNYILSPKGRAEPSAPELLLLGGAGRSIGKALETTVEKGSVLAKEAGSVVGAFANKYPKTTEGIVVGTVSTGFDLKKGEATPEKTMLNYVLGGALAGKPVPYQLSVNAIYKGIEYSGEKKSDSEMIAGQAASAVGTVSGYWAEYLLDLLKINSAGKQVISNIFSNYFENSTEDILNDNINNKIEPDGDK